ncbi:MAG: response regulator [Tepidisphaeraceae bacterium]|jgi:two-component system OmpR family response regulator
MSDNNNGPIKVMIADDDPTSLMILETVVKSLGIETATAENVAGANALFERFQPDIAILDVMLPDGDGVDILRHIRKSKRRTAVAMISASLADFPFHKCETDQPDKIFSKPFDPVTIRSWIEEQLKDMKKNGRRSCLFV